MASGCLGLISLPARAGAGHARAHRRALPAGCSRRCASTRASASCSCAPSSTARSCSARTGVALPRRGPGRGRGPAGAVRPRRRAPRAAHRRLPPLPRHRRQQHLLGTSPTRSPRSRSSSARTAGLGGTQAYPVRAAPVELAAAGGGHRRRRGRPLAPATLACRAGARGVRRARAPGSGGAPYPDRLGRFPAGAGNSAAVWRRSR